MTTAIIPLSKVAQELKTTVLSKVQALVKDKGLSIPSWYSPENALSAAQLILVNTVDRNKQPVLQSCTRESIALSLLDMVTQGLNPSKKQCYFIAYGQQLTMMRSYFGTMELCKTVAGAKDIWAQVVYEGDEFEYSIVRGKKVVTKHTQKLENTDSSKIIAAYAGVEFSDGTVTGDIMTIEQIHKSWSKSKQNPGGAESVHSQFTEEMCKRTVINRVCKPLINSSTDQALLDSLSRSELAEAEAEVAEKIAAEANHGVIDVPAIECQPEEKKPEIEAVSAETQAQSEATAPADPSTEPEWA